MSDPTPIRNGWKVPGHGGDKVALGEDARREITGILDSYFRLTLRVDLDEDIPACADDLASLVAQAYVAGGERWERAYYEKQEQFAAETRRTSAMLQACGREAVPRAVVGEALLGYWSAQEDIARAGRGMT